MWEDIILVSDEYIKVFIGQDTVRSILRHKRSLIRGKDFGLLIGTVEARDGTFFVNIENIFPVGRLDGIDGKLDDTKLLDVKVKVADKYPGKVVVGWYGVRTGWGAMMMEEDQSIHQRFFSKKWQIMYLLDDRSDIDNFYIWRDGRLKTYSGDYTYGGLESKDDKNYVKWPITFAVVAILLFFIYPRYIRGILYDSHNEEQENGAREELEENLQETREEPSEIEEEPKQVSKPEDTYNESEKELEKLRETIEQLEHEIEDKEQKFKVAEADQDEFAKAKEIVYKVEAGDTLSSISKKFYGDSKYSKSLGKVNRISDHKTLQVGSYLIIPPKEEMRE